MLTPAQSEAIKQWTPKHWLGITRALIKKWAELTIADIDKDVARLGELDEYDGIYLRAYWVSLQDRLFPVPEKVDLPATTIEDLNKETKLIEDFFHVRFPNSNISRNLKEDVQAKLNSLKKRLADEFETHVLEVVDRFQIESPIEQMFLLEWCYARIEDIYGLHLEPQKEVNTEKGVFRLDYLIRSKKDGVHSFSVAIELDGHEFHEKTKTQAAYDKQRERAILHAGVEKELVILRFTGSEVFRNCNACLQEIVRFIEAKRRKLSEFNLKL